MKEADDNTVPGSVDSGAPLSPHHNLDEEQGVAMDPKVHETDEEIPELSMPMTLGLLVVVTVLVAVTAEFLVSSIDGLASGGGISKEFIGLILLPIVGNAAEHVTAVTVSVKDKLTLSLGVAVGSSIVSSFFPPRRYAINPHLANRVVRNPIHRRPWVDHRSPGHHALRSVRVDHTLLRRVDGQLRRSRRQVKLAGRNDPGLFVRPNPSCCFSSGADVKHVGVQICYNRGRVLVLPWNAADWTPDLHGVTFGQVCTSLPFH